MVCIVVKQSSQLHGVRVGYKMGLLRPSFSYLRFTQSQSNPLPVEHSSTSMVSQKMRCGQCGHTAEMDIPSISNIEQWYRETARYMRRCPRCGSQSYALSAYDNAGLRELRRKGESHVGRSELRGAWYCTVSGHLRQFS